MKLVLTGSLGNISKPLAQQLIAQGHAVTIISHSPARSDAILAKNATPVIGSLEDVDFLTETFQAADAIYTMVPPDFSVPDYTQFAQKVSTNYAKAIRQVGVRYVVNLSSVGSAVAGQPPLTEYYNLETELNALPDVNVLHLRPGMFYTNFYGVLPMIKYQNILGNNFDGEVIMPMSHPADIATVAAKALHHRNFEGKSAVHIVSDQKSGNEIAQLLGKAIGKPELQWIAFSDSQLLSALQQNGFSEYIAQHYFVDMGIAIREGVLSRFYQMHISETVGNIPFEEFVKDFALAYAQS